MRRSIVGLCFTTFAATAGCSSDGSDINQPGVPSPPANTISITFGAENKGVTAFTPNPLTISLAAGGVVKWVNNDVGRDDGYGGVVGGAAHNIIADDGSFDSDTLSPGSTFETTFVEEGTHPYHCSIHPAMTGEVTVAP